MPDSLATALRERYRIERELGAGGMAVVYLAHDLRHDRPVALKVLHAELARALGPERFQREIRLAARLQHPHILSVYDSGEAAGLLWFTMPYVDGESLRERLSRETQLPIEDALRITREIASALSYAHAHDVIHRDIKPENILLANGLAMLADFGIARALDASTGSRLTATGLAIGTPAYMSPEQADAESDLDPRSDLYSLGTVLYEMLAGEPPFTGRSSQAVIVRRLAGIVPPLRPLRPAVPENVERAVLKALALAKADRFASADEFAAALRASEVARPKVPAVAVLPFLNLSADPANEYFADGITEDVIAQLSKIRALKVISRTSVMQFKKREQSLREIGAKLEATTLLEGSVRRAGDRVRIVAQLIGFIAQHVASDNYLFCDQFGDKKSSLPEKDTATPDSIKATWPKDTLVAKLKASFAFCQDAIAQLEDSKLADQVTLTFRGNSRNVARINMVLGHALDLADHYSQLANYMRLNGMLPPSALPRPRPGS